MSYSLKELGKVCKFVRGPFGGSLKKDIFVEDGYAVYEQQHAIYNQFSEIRYFVDEEKFNEMSRFELFPNDLIMSCSGTMGKVAIVPSGIKKGVINQALLKLTPNDEIDVFYLKWLMTSSYFQEEINKLSAGAAIQNVASVATLKQIKIPFPPLTIQKRIVAKLDAVFAVIDKATAAAQSNAGNAEALFESYLRQVFEVEGKEWQTTKVSELGRVQSGGTPSISKKEYWGNEIEWFSSGELNDLYTLASIRRITLDGIKNSNAKVFPINSLLIGMYDTAAMKMSLLSNPAAFNQAVVGIEPTEKLNMVFLYYALAYIKPYVLSLRRGVRQKNLSLAKIKDLFIQIPKNIDIQNEVAERLNFFKDTTNKLKIGYLEKINQNIKLKNSILKQAFSGELVKE